MRVVLDTHVLVSGVFFTGPPYMILRAWRDGQVQLVISAEIVDEYHRVGEVMAEGFPGVDFPPILHLLAVVVELVHAPKLPEPVCSDPDDDNFLACALAGGTRLIISGDKGLLRSSGYRGIKVIRPRAFVDEYLA